MGQIRITANVTAVRELEELFKELNLELLADEIERGYTNIWLITSSDPFMLEQIEDSIIDEIERTNPFLREEFELEKIEE